MAIGRKRAEVLLTADPRGVRRGLSAAQSALGAFARGATKTLGKGMRGAGRGVARAFDPLGRAWGLVADQVDEVKDFERRIARLGIAQGKTNEQMAGFRREVTGVSRETGVARNEILQGIGTYQALTGDTEGATAAMKTFARVSQATGSSMDDVAATGAALGQSLKIDPADFEKAFSILNSQGKAGAVELKDLAGEMASLAPQWQRFAGSSGVTGMTNMGAALQLVRRNFGSAAEAGTGFRALMTAIVRNAKKLEAGGVEIFTKNAKTGKKELRGFNEVIDSIGRSKLMKDPTKLTKALGSSEAERALLGLTNNWDDLQRLIESTDTSSIGKDLDQYLASPAGRIDAAMNNLKLSAAEAFTPERIQAFAQAVEQAAGLMGKLVGALDKVGTFLESLKGEKKLLSDTDQARYKAKIGAAPTGAVGDEISRFTNVYSFADNIKARKVYEDQKASDARATDYRAGGVLADRFQGGGSPIIGFRAEEARAFIDQQLVGARVAAASGAPIPLEQLEETLTRALRAAGAPTGSPWNVPPVVVQVDGDAVAKATADASRHRRRPGG